MSEEAITVPAAFAEAAITRDGEAGRRWITELPALVTSLCTRWGLVVAGAVMHGYLSLVIPVRRADTPCVLKVSWIDESTKDEALALEAWAGRGAVRLLAAEPALGAMLLEQLDHKLPTVLALRVSAYFRDRSAGRLKLTRLGGLRSEISITRSRLPFSSSPLSPLGGGQGEGADGEAQASHPEGKRWIVDWTL